MLSNLSNPAGAIFIPIIIVFSFALAIKTIRALVAREVLEYRRYF